jgi:hypothetical protein
LDIRHSTQLSIASPHLHDVLIARYSDLTQGKISPMVPRDYSIERLYASLSSAAWGSFDLNTSTFGKDPLTGKDITLENWKAANPGSEDALKTFLTGWFQSQQKAGLTLLGAEFLLATPQQCRAAQI